MKNKDLLKGLFDEVFNALTCVGMHDTEEKQMYVMIDNVYFPVYDWEIVEEDDGTLNLRINGGDGSITQ